MRQFPHIFNSNKSRVLDIGSLDINGGPHLEITSKYLGVDIGAGPNVDVICPAEKLDLPTETFDATISSECLEHNPFWRETLFQMARLTKKGGLVIWTCAGIGRAKHGTSDSADFGISAPHVASTYNYYRNIDARLAMTAINFDGWFDNYAFFENLKSHDTYFIGLRTGSSSGDAATFSQLKERFTSQYGDVNSFRLRRLLYDKGLTGIVEGYFNFIRYLIVIKRADRRLDRTQIKIKKWISKLKKEISLRVVK
jgi:SAM-dependent methyltransferase